MFKSSKIMAKVKFLLQSKSENSQIYIRLSISQFVSLKKKTGFTISPKDWSETNFPKQTKPENKVLSTNLKKLEIFVLENLNKDLAKNTLIDAYWLEKQIDTCFERVSKNDAGLLVNHIQYIIDNANTRKVIGRKNLGLSQSRVKGYTTFKNLFTVYQTVIKKQITFLDINKTFVDKFINWLVNSKGYSMNYAGKQIDNLKTVCIDAEKNDIKINPYVSQIQGFSENDDDRYIQTLSFVELELIRTAEIKKPAYDNARKWLLIGCEIGQRGGDLLNITKDNIRYKSGNMYLDVIQQKTGKSVTVGIINPNIIDIIENDFPHKISTQKLNDYIKKVCEIAKINESVEGTKLIVTKTGKRILNLKGKYIDETERRKKLDFYPKHELITTHSFRRSFCTNYYKKIPTAVLMGISGHSKESLFLTYINQREDKDSNADLFMKFYSDIHKNKAPEMKVILNTGTE